MSFALAVIASTTKPNEIVQNLFIFNDQLKIKIRIKIEPMLFNLESSLNKITRKEAAFILKLV